MGDPENLLHLEVEEQISSRAILCTENEKCFRIKTTLSGRSHESESIESKDPEEIANFPIEFPYTFKVFGIPPHILELKLGATIIFSKNIDSRQGLCNGTRLGIKSLMENHIHLSRLYALISQRPAITSRAVKKIGTDSFA